MRNEGQGGMRDRGWERVAGMNVVRFGLVWGVVCLCEGHLLGKGQCGVWEVIE